MINAGSGDDVIYANIVNSNDLASDTTDGGSGSDTLNFAIDSSSGGFSGDAGVTFSLLSPGSVSSVENLVGSIGADTLTGDGSANTILGGEGGDTLQGEGGDDVLAGDYWSGTLAGLGTTTEFGVEFVSLGERVDRSVSGAGDDVLYGLGGDDTLDGGAGADTLSGGAGADTFRINSASDYGDVITDFATASGGGNDSFDFNVALTGGDGTANNTGFANDHANADVSGSSNAVFEFVQSVLSLSGEQSFFTVEAAGQSALAGTFVTGRLDDDQPGGPLRSGRHGQRRDLRSGRYRRRHHLGERGLAGRFSGGHRRRQPHRRRLRARGVVLEIAFGHAETVACEQDRLASVTIVTRCRLCRTRSSAPRTQGLRETRRPSWGWPPREFP